MTNETMEQQAGQGTDVPGIETWTIRQSEAQSEFSGWPDRTAPYGAGIVVTIRVPGDCLDEGSVSVRFTTYNTPGHAYPATAQRASFDVYAWDRVRVGPGAPGRHPRRRG